MNLPRELFRLMLGRRLPTTSGTCRVEGTDDRITIRRDRYSVPYVEASTDRDAWYGLGFAQGQDRAFQIEMLLRTVRGTMAEILGSDAVQVDRLCRRLGFLASARAQADVVEPDIHEALEGFAHGLYQGATQGCERLAHEFALLRTRPSRCEVADVLAIMKYIAFAISVWSAKFTRQIVLREDGPEAVAALSNDYGYWMPVTSPVGAPCGPELDRLGEDLDRLAEICPWRGASNGWAVSPSRTATGRPILANDPHFSLLLPNPWYLAQIRTPQWAIMGAGFAGLACFPAGHNGRIAWGITAGCADDNDLFLEEVGPDGESIRQGDEFVPCEVRREQILVKGAETIEEKVLVTPRGPIVSPALEGHKEAISIRATWMAETPVHGLFRLHRADNFDDFRQAFACWPQASLGIVYADTGSNIGWLLAGDVPKRREGSGTVPMPGWLSDCSSAPELVAAEDMPFEINPQEAILATANNKPVHDGDGLFLGREWADGYRHARILEALAERHDWDIAGTEKLQMDELSIPWREIRDIVLAAPASSEQTREALGLLAAWNGKIQANCPATSVYELFLSEMAWRVVRLKAPRSTEWAMGKVFNEIMIRSYFGIRRVSHVVRLLRDQPAGWFERPWSEEIADALDAVIRKLRREHGPAARWSWGKVRNFTQIHLVNFFRHRRLLGRIFDIGPIPWGGDSETIGAAERTLFDPTRNPLGMANMRMVLDIGNWQESRFILSSGQSGNPCSPHYADQVPLWKAGKTIRIAWEPEAVAAAAASTLHLEPARKSERSGPPENG